MNTEHRDGWILLKPDSYLAIPASAFLAVAKDAVNIKSEWQTKGGKLMTVSSDPMDMLFVSSDQMTSIRVRDRLTQASEPDQ